MTKDEAITLLQNGVNLIKKDYPDIADYAEALQMAIEALHQFADPGKKVSSSCGQENDMVYRQAAIDWLTNEWDGMVTSLFDGIKALPAAQPNIIRCGECRHLHDNDCPVVGWGRDDDDYCAWAERDNDG